MRSFFGAIVFVLILAFGQKVTAEETSASKLPPAVLSLEIGAGSWLGDFRSHLDRDGAYTMTPALDFTLRIPLDKTWGIEGLLGSACVVHPQSEPVEGTFFYQGLGLFLAFPCEAWSFRVGAGAGFEHATLLLGTYSSGYAEASAGCAYRINQRLSWNASLRFRAGFLPSLTIPRVYGLDHIDTPKSLSLTTGVSYSF